MDNGNVFLSGIDCVISGMITSSNWKSFTRAGLNKGKNQVNEGKGNRMV